MSEWPVEPLPGRALVRCEWCEKPLLPADAVRDNRGAPRCADGASCALRAGELQWAGKGHTRWCLTDDDPRGCPSCDPEARLYDRLPGRWCCLDPGCNHPREQVFNGGAGA